MKQLSSLSSPTVTKLYVSRALSAWAESAIVYCKHYQWPADTVPIPLLTKPVKGYVHKNVLGSPRLRQKFGTGAKKAEAVTDSPRSFGISQQQFACWWICLTDGQLIATNLIALALLTITRERWKGKWLNVVDQCTLVILCRSWWGDG